MYIDDLAAASKCKSYLFADNTTLQLSHKNNKRESKRTSDFKKFKIGLIQTINYKSHKN